MPLRRPHDQALVLDRPFTPVSPLNLEPITSRSQQVSLQELAFINEHLAHNHHHHHHHLHTPHAYHLPRGRGTRSGWSTPLATASASALATPTEDYFGFVPFDEEDDKREEIRADAERPFPVDRALLKETIRQHMHSPVVRMQFLSSGTFHKAFLAALEDGRQVVARIARRFMPRLKTESEVATINYLRLHTPIPVPIIYHWDSNPYNRLGHEYIIMSKAPGIPLRAVWNRMRDEEQHALLRNLARLVVDLSTHRFSHVGSLYQKPREKVAPVSSSATAGQVPGLANQNGSSTSLAASSSASAWPPGMKVIPIPSPPRVGDVSSRDAAPAPAGGLSSDSGSSSASSPASSPSPTPSLTASSEATSISMASSLPPQPGLASTRSSPSVPTSPLPHSKSTSPTVDLSFTFPPKIANIPSIPISSLPSPPSLPHRLVISPHKTSQAQSQTQSQTTPQQLVAENDDLEFFIGPIVSWPFFGDGRGELESSTEIDRGPWPTEEAYLAACARREIDAVKREGAGKERGHRPHLPPRDRLTRHGSSGVGGVGVGMGGFMALGTGTIGGPSRSRSRTGTAVHSLSAMTKSSAGQTPQNPYAYSSPHSSSRDDYPSGPASSRAYSHSISTHGTSASVDLTSDSETSSYLSDDDELSTSSSSSSSSSEDDETFYRDYRANLRSSLLVAQHATRLRAVEEDMKRFRSVMERELKGVERELAAVLSGTGLGGDGSFVLHAHDLSLANIFVDEDDPSRITCIIDWESSAIRPLWHAAHLPSFLLPPPPHAHNTAAHASSSHGVPNPEMQAAFRRFVGDMNLSRFGDSTPSSPIYNLPSSQSPLCPKSKPPPSTPSSNNTLPGKLWLAAERAGDTARDLHRFVEWDGWEEGLLETVVGHDRLAVVKEEEEEEVRRNRALSSASNASSASGMGTREGRGNGTFKMANGFIGLSLT